jgi:Asp-tRNA(Asn)/Glu-tRNA(Gln) amidotransferase A subunit family amidase
MQRARALDSQASAGLLHGLPIAVKDLFDTFDMPTSYGSPIYENHRPAADAASVALARAAGAIVVGKTVTTEFATFNPGPTCNPCNLKHTPGGSSSGSAAAVADRNGSARPGHPDGPAPSSVRRHFAASSDTSRPMARSTASA